MNLATRCPACTTVFRVVEDQLKVSEGWVRCGRCHEVFNAVEALIDLDRDPWPVASPEPEREATAVAGPGPSTDLARPDDRAAARPMPHERPSEPAPADPAPTSGIAPAPPHAPDLDADRIDPAPPEPRHDRTGADPVLDFGAPTGPASIEARPLPTPPAGPSFGPTPPWPASATPVGALPEAPVSDGYTSEPPPFELDLGPAAARPPSPGRDAGPAADRSPVREPSNDRDVDPATGRRLEDEPSFDLDLGDAHHPPIDRGARPVAPAWPAAPRVPSADRTAPPASGPDAIDLPPVDEPSFELDLRPATPRPSAAAGPRPSEAGPVGHGPSGPGTRPVDREPSWGAPEGLAAGRAEPAGAGRATLREPAFDPAPSIATDRSGDANPAPMGDRVRGDAALDRDVHPETPPTPPARPYGAARDVDASPTPPAAATATPTSSPVATRRSPAGWIVALLLALALAAQLVHWQRDAIAARWPALRPALESACRPLGCRVEAPRRIEDVAVENTGLARTATPGVFQLSVGLRNRGAVPNTTPSIELTLTDANGVLLVRKVLAPADFASAPPVLPAGGDAALTTVLATPGPQVSGYTVEVFYP